MIGKLIKKGWMTEMELLIIILVAWFILRILSDEGDKIADQKAGESVREKKRKNERLIQDRADFFSSWGVEDK